MSEFFEPWYDDLSSTEEKCSDWAKAATVIIILLSLIKTLFHKDDDDTDGRD